MHCPCSAVKVYVICDSLFLMRSVACKRAAIAVNNNHAVDCVCVWVSRLTALCLGWLEPRSPWHSYRRSLSNQMLVVSRSQLTDCPVAWPAGIAVHGSKWAGVSVSPRSCGGVADEEGNRWYIFRATYVHIPSGELFQHSMYPPRYIVAHRVGRRLKGCVRVVVTPDEFKYPKRTLPLRSACARTHVQETWGKSVSGIHTQYRRAVVNRWPPNNVCLRWEITGLVDTRQTNSICILKGTLYTAIR